MCREIFNIVRSNWFSGYFQWSFHACKIASVFYTVFRSINKIEIFIIPVNASIELLMDKMDNTEKLNMIFYDDDSAS